MMSVSLTMSDILTSVSLLAVLNIE